MPFVTSIERLGMLRMIEDTLRLKFGAEGVALVPVIHELNDAEKLLALNRVLVKATTLDEVRRACAEAARPARRRKKGGQGEHDSTS